MESSPLGRYCIDATEKRKLVSILMFIITGVCNGLLYFERQIKVHIIVGLGEKMYLCTVVAPMCRAGCGGGHPSPCPAVERERTDEIEGGKKDAACTCHI